MQRFYSELEDVRTWFGRTKFLYRDGEVQSRRDRHLCEFFLSLQPFLVQDLLPESQCDRELKAHVGDTFVSGEFATGAKAVANALRRYYNDDLQFQDYLTVCRDVRHLSFSMWYLLPLGKLKDLIRDQHVDGLRKGLQFLEIGIKCNMLDLDLAGDCLSTYLLDEETMRSESHPRCDRIKRELRSLPQPRLDRGRHGNGATYQCPKGSSWEEKSKYFSSDDLIQFSALEGLLPPHAYLTRLDRVNKLQVVPKSLDTNRMISMEQVTLQFLQQGVQDALRDAVSHSWLKHHIHFRDQEFSQSLAREGSIVGEYATIDLSSASDFVLWSDVRASFPPSWRRLFLAVRSQYAETPDGTRVKLKKMSPMGSAICFPVMTIFFCGLIKAVARERGIRKPRFLVYGDDIVLPERLVKPVCDELKSFGFTVNFRKSFSGQTVNNFREACGGEYFNGFTVTPTRISRWYTWSWNDPIGPVEFEKIRSLVNNLTASNLLKSRRAVITAYARRQLRNGQDPWLACPFRSDGNYGFLPSPHSTSWSKNDFMRWNEDWQIWEELVYTSINGTDRGNEDVAYLRWLIDRSGHTDQPAERLPVAVGQGHSEEAFLWVAAE